MPPLNYLSAILYFDHLITIPAEVSCIWKRNLTMSSILFVINRYCAFVGYILVLGFIFWPPENLIVRNLIRSCLRLATDNHMTLFGRQACV